ncbi:MFS transporter [Reinekea marina]|uniref:MFS transporter n=1 Tax=Reinekea marina TaxID=1310421 RepID=A0ABV7WQF8_9GAMM|nr:MFS transporter [Reinekea marina]MDN3648670.1 MFS transporter [Reinekea marina]
MALNSLERKALSGLAMLYASRMLGLFMVLPVLTLYGQELSEATPLLLGVALGIYGVTQALLQIPFGSLSDRYGRKPLIYFGLVLFLIGSLLCAFSNNVFGMIVGRALQGSGAISSVVLAMLADYTREEERSKSMAIVGAVIGASFVVAVVLGPIISGFSGLSGLFWFTAGLALVSMLIVAKLPPVPDARVHEERQVKTSLIGTVIKNPFVGVLSTGIFLLHVTMTSVFVGLPLILVERGLASEQLGWVYGPVMVLAFIGMAPMMMFAEKRQAQLPYLKMAAAFMVVALGSLASYSGLWFSAFALWLFFVGFNFVEATLPSLLSRRVEPGVRGTAMGVFATSQFLGAAIGGIAGGYVYTLAGFLGIAILGVVANILWSVMLLVLKSSPQSKPA